MLQQKVTGNRKEKEGLTMSFVILLLVGLFAVAAFKIANEKDKDDWNSEVLVKIDLIHKYIRKLNDM